MLLWKVLDFEKVFDDSNRLRELNGEGLENYLDIYNELIRDRRPIDKYGKRLNKKKDFITAVPVLAFKRILRSPEYLDSEYCRASNIQKTLWREHTAEDERFKLWFDFFTPFYRTKLWNRLSFSEDYLINIINTPKLSRQDLAIKVTKALCNIKRDYLELLLNDFKDIQEQSENKSATLKSKKVQKMRNLVNKLKSG